MRRVQIACAGLIVCGASWALCLEPAGHQAVVPVPIRTAAKGSTEIKPGPQPLTEETPADNSEQPLPPARKVPLLEETPTESQPSPSAATPAPAPKKSPNADPSLSSELLRSKPAPSKHMAPSLSDPIPQRSPRVVNADQLLYERAAYRARQRLSRIEERKWAGILTGRPNAATHANQFDPFQFSSPNPGYYNGTHSRGTGYGVWLW